MTAPARSIPVTGSGLRLLIVGGGVAGWSAAALLARRLQGVPGVAVRVLETPVDDPPAVATLPTALGFHADIGLDEAALLAAAGGTFRLGTRFEDWTADGASSFEPFGGIGASLGGAPFQHALAAAREAGEPVSPEAFSLAAIAAGLGRFARPSRDPRSVLSTLGYALHLEAGGYVDALRARAVALGAEPLAGEVAAVETHSGGIAALRLSSGERLTADLFLDATGGAAQLIGRLDEAFEDWSCEAPIDRRLDARLAIATAPAPYTTLTAHAAGWRLVTPLRTAVDHMFAFASAEMDEAAARRAFAATAGETAAEGAPLTSLRIGRRPRAWIGNCVALGATAGAPGRFDLDAHLAHSSAERLLRLLPTAGGAPMAAAEFNRLTEEEMVRLRDFSLVRLRLNGRRGEPMWDRLRETRGPDSLEYKIALFASRGRVALYEGEVFPEDSWVAAFLAQGVWPARHDVRVDAAPPGVLQDQLRRMTAAMQAAAQAMPSHAEALAALRPQVAR